MEIEKTITLVMTLEEAEDSVLALKTLPQIEDADITFTDDGGYVVSAGLEGRTISFSSHEAFQEFFGRTWPDSLLTHAILGQNDVPIPCTHQLYIQWYVAGGRSNCEKDETKEMVGMSSPCFRDQAGPETDRTYSGGS